MKQKGISREVDSLGRIVIPKAIRKQLGIEEKDKLDIRTEGETIIVTKYTPFCTFCGSEEELSDFAEKKICKACLDKIKTI